MGQWLNDHSEVVAAMANVAMVVIWLLYLQLFYRMFRRRTAERWYTQGNRLKRDAVDRGSERHPAEVQE